MPLNKISQFEVGPDGKSIIGDAPKEIVALVQSDDYTLPEKMLGQLLHNLRLLRGTNELSEKGYFVMMEHFNSIAGLLHPRPEKVEEFAEMFNKATAVLNGVSVNN